MKNEPSVQHNHLLISKSEINGLDNPAILRQPCTLFNIHVLDLKRMVEMPDEPGTDSFAPETKVAQGMWTLY